MARAMEVQSAFISGEFSERLFGRIDIERFQTGLATMENMILKPGGGVFRTPGTKYLGEVKDSSKSTRLLPFIFSADDALIVELGDQYARFWGSDGNVIGAPVEVSPPFLEAELFDVQYAQSRDVMYLLHPNHEPQILTRTSATTFTIADVTWDFAPVRLISGGERAKATGFSTWTDGSTGSIEYENTPSYSLDSSYVGKHFKLTDPADPDKTAILKVTATDTSKKLDVTAVGDIPGSLQNSYTELVLEPAFTTDFGFPSAVCFFEERLWFGGTDKDPGMFWGSRTADFLDHNPGDSADDDALRFELGGGEAQYIEWMSGGQELLIGTTASVHKATGGVQEAITPTRVYRREQSRFGCASIDTVLAGYHTLFVQRARHKVRALTFQDAQASYADTDLSAAADHIFRNSRIFSLTYAESRDQIVWMSDNNGKLAGMTFDPSNNVIGWHRHPDDNGAYESITVIPQDEFNEVWFVVNRTIDGNTKRYIERMVEGDWAPSEQEDFFYLRSGIEQTGSGFTTVTGLTHLEGESVMVLGDGSPQGPFTVDASGEIELDTAVDKAQVGLTYTSKLKTLPVPKATGQRVGWSEIMARLYQSMSYTVNGIARGLRTPQDPMGQPIEPVSKDIEVEGAGYDLRGQQEFSTSDPLPLNILMISGTLSIGEG